MQTEGLLCFGNIEHLTSFWNQISSELCVFQNVSLVDGSSKAKK